MNFYFQKCFSRSQWLKHNRMSCHWSTEEDGADGKILKYEKSKPFDLRDIERHIHSRSCFNWEEFELFPPGCPWLDSSIGIGWGSHFTDGSGETVYFELPMPLGAAFPIVPRLDREGRIFSSMQSILAGNILDLRKRIVVEASGFNSPEWLNLLRIYIADCVSLIEITLHAIYIKAEFDPLEGWVFDLKNLGPRHGRRIKDKLRWVGQITGAPLDDQNRELESFHLLRSVRNHLQHFDPPCFGFSLEDVQIWLNSSTNIGRLALAIRKRLCSPPSPSLISLVAAPNIAFHPKNSGKKRITQDDSNGYASTCWPIGPAKRKSEGQGVIRLSVKKRTIFGATPPDKP